MLLQMFASLTIITFSSFEVILSKNRISFEFITRLQYLSFVLLELFIYCMKGEQIKTRVTILFCAFIKNLKVIIIISEP